MRLARIKNKYLYNDDNPNGVHTYALYYDRKNKEYRAVALTHLYVKDKKRFKQVRNGNIMVEKFKEFNVPTGVQNYYYSRNINGGKIDLQDKSNVVKVSTRYLSKKQSSKIKSFARKNYNKQKKEFP